MGQVRLDHFAISLDGFASGEGQSADAPFGHAGMRLVEWFLATRSFQARHGVDPGVETPDDAFVAFETAPAGAEILGAGKFGPPGWQDDPEWHGWWGDEPPFHSPVIVLTHRPRELLTLGETTFHFMTADAHAALAAARELAGEADVRIGGGAATARQFLEAGLVDRIHLVVVPILLGRGSRLWEGLEGLERGYTVESTTTPSGVTHVIMTRAAEAS